MPLHGLHPPARYTMPQADRKSTRLNSSHGYISYAVFCLKKKNHVNPRTSIEFRHQRLIVLEVSDRDVSFSAGGPRVSTFWICSSSAQNARAPPEPHERQ